MFLFWLPAMFLFLAYSNSLFFGCCTLSIRYTIRYYIFWLSTHRILFSVCFFFLYSSAIVLILLSGCATLYFLHHHHTLYHTLPYTLSFCLGFYFHSGCASPILFWFVEYVFSILPVCFALSLFCYSRAIFYPARYCTISHNIPACFYPPMLLLCYTGCFLYSGALFCFCFPCLHSLSVSLSVYAVALLFLFASLSNYIPASIFVCLLMVVYSVVLCL